jgi:3-phosphoshikimate 1-carboxyvinyltransferase
MADISDTAQTLAAVAPFADGPTTVRGIGFIRGKETDRIAAVVEQLRSLGIDATEDPDGFTVRPGVPRPGVVRTYDDHRMAMSFAVLGLCAPGIAIEDPRCVDKTFPGFWEVVADLRGRAGSGSVP